MGILAMLNHLANWRRLVILVLVNLQDKIINLLGVSSSQIENSKTNTKSVFFAISQHFPKLSLHQIGPVQDSIEPQFFESIA